MFVGHQTMEDLRLVRPIRSEISLRWSQGEQSTAIRIARAFTDVNRRPRRTLGGRKRSTDSQTTPRRFSFSWRRPAGILLRRSEPCAGSDTRAVPYSGMLRASPVKPPRQAADLFDVSLDRNPRPTETLAL